MENNQSDAATNPLLMKTYLQEKIDAVSLYVQRGWYVLPLDHIHGKKPINNGGRNNPYKFPEDAEKAWTVKHPLANIGIVTGQESLLYVIDIDGKGDDYEVFKRCLPKTSEVRTSKGMHYYYNRPENYPHKLGNKVRNLIPGMDIDVRCDGGYVVAPPSINPITQYKYQFVDDQETSIAPSWLLDLHTTGSTTNAPKEIQELYAKYDKELSKEQVKIEQRRNGNQIDLKSMQKITDKIILAKIDEASNAKVGERNKLLNDAVFTMAGLIHTGEISETQVADIGYEIANANGLLADDGQRSILAVIKSAISSGLSKRLIVTRTEKNRIQMRAIDATQIIQADTSSPMTASSKIKNGEIKLSSGTVILDEMIEVITEMDLLYTDVATGNIMVARIPPWHSFYSDPTQHPRLLMDAEAVELMAWAEKKLGVKMNKARAMDIIDAAAGRRQRDLLREYVRECGLRWDGVPRIRSWVSVYLGVRATDIAHEFGFRWLLQMANRALNPGCKADGVLVIEGPQGVGKSTALRNLVPSEYFLDDLKDFEHNPKDAALECARFWLCEDAENKILSGKSSNSLKQFIGKQEETLRVAYGRNAKRLLRRINFAITTNHFGYLHDTTGNRRFYPILVDGKIDTFGIARDKDQFWGEAVHLLSRGEKTFLSDEFASLHGIETDDRLSEDVWESDIKRYISKTLKPIRISDVMEYLQIPKERQAKRDQYRIADILRKLKYEQTKGVIDGEQVRYWKKIQTPLAKIMNEIVEKETTAEKHTLKTAISEKTYDVVIPEDDDYGF